MSSTIKLIAVSREEFNDFVKEFMLSPSGFGINGGMLQTRWRDFDGDERARSSEDSFGGVWEVDEEAFSRE